MECKIIVIKKEWNGNKKKKKNRTPTKHGSTTILPQSNINDTLKCFVFFIFFFVVVVFRSWQPDHFQGNKHDFLEAGKKIRRNCLLIHVV